MFLASVEVCVKPLSFCVMGVHMQPIKSKDYKRGTHNQ
uniref:Uncharacterized protein n=1 Tax=Rhizophora mucronata TaxID=61149 RepID=A0A2P2QZE0_RHIMU